ncbi:MAG: MBL fold metallo-hydrolase [Elainellaceae cyanobacterium]
MSQSQAGFSHEFIVKFWGVRGSIPTPGMDTVRYGGNTACIEILVAGQRLILDGGTGLRPLGKSLLKEMPVQAHLFFTHTHWDRIQGFPFFVPAFVEGNSFDIYGATGLNGASIKQRLTDQMLRPNFPVPLQVMRSNLRFHDIAPGSIIPIDDIIVETVSLNRPNSALGYRITWNGYSVVYATDTEHSAECPDQSLLYLAHQADLLIFDATYGDHAYYDPKVAEMKRNPEMWHANIEAALAAKAKRIIMFHHDPSHEDDFLDRVEAEAQSNYPNVQLAREGMVCCLCVE